ncbi:uncharacterized protein LOC142228208 [Haematobia irritans]|uniref:uncharacterized protein LOC142228208 n=1 Tax=Haematobia irritans TaxID=7368 RepID=UPI003F5050E2
MGKFEERKEIGQYNTIEMETTSKNESPVHKNSSKVIIRLKPDGLQLDMMKTLKTLQPAMDAADPKRHNVTVRSVDLNEGITINRRFGEGVRPIFDRADVKANAISKHESDNDDVKKETPKTSDKRKSNMYDKNGPQHMYNKNGPRSSPNYETTRSSHPRRKSLSRPSRSSRSRDRCLSRKRNRSMYLSSSNDRRAFAIRCHSLRRSCSMYRTRKRSPHPIDSSHNSYSPQHRSGITHTEKRRLRSPNNDRRLHESGGHYTYPKTRREINKDRYNNRIHESKPPMLLPFMPMAVGVPDYSYPYSGRSPYCPLQRPPHRYPHPYYMPSPIVSMTPALCYLSLYAAWE